MAMKLSTETYNWNIWEWVLLELKDDQHGLYVWVSSRDERGTVARSDIEGGLVGGGGKVDVHLESFWEVHKKLM